MSTTTYAAKRKRDMPCYYDFTFNYWRGPHQRGLSTFTHDVKLVREVMVGFPGAVLVRRTRYTREESRARAEARGEVRALEAVYSTYTDALEVWEMLIDARTRAGLREGGRGQ